MATVYETPFDIWRGTEVVVTVAAAITAGGDAKVFYLRVGKIGAKAQVQKTMTESDNTSTSVNLSCTLTATDTNAIKDSVIDFQVVVDSPSDVLTEGKFRMRGMLRSI